MCNACLPTPSNIEQPDAFADRMLEMLNQGALALMVSIGHRTGLFDAMAELPPATIGQIFAHTGLPTHDHTVADLKMAGDAHLAGGNAVVAQGGGAGDTHLGNQKAVGTDLGAMPDHHRIPDLAALANHGVFNGAALDAAAGAQFHIIFDDNSSV